MLELHRSNEGTKASFSILKVWYILCKKGSQNLKNGKLIYVFIGLQFHSFSSAS